MSKRVILLCAVVFLLVTGRGSLAQPYGKADADAPGDAMIQAYLARETEKIHGRIQEDLASADKWKEQRPRRVQEFYHMLGLWPIPEKTPLNATVAGKVEHDDVVIELLHYQSVPRLYVTANLYRPGKVEPGERLPAVLYVCGHSGRERNGNKTAFQSHGLWFARHGYVCLVVDTLQLGEIAAIHHGTYREDRWWWHSRGYTPAGVECWNGVRGIDYLVSRPEVDPERIAVTGISGGGAATFWVACADERVKVAVPVSGMADLPSYVTNRVINGHCDCMFLYNTFQWPWTRIAALFAPRPLLFVNSDNDAIFPMDANERIIHRLERVYSLYGAGDRVDSLVSIGGHDYRRDIRQGVAWFFNAHLKRDATPVGDTEVDLVIEARNNNRHPIAPEKLRVFPADSDIPKDQLNTTIDQHFVPVALIAPPSSDHFDGWRSKLKAELRRVSFPVLPDRVPPGTPIETKEGITRLATEEGIAIRLVESKMDNIADKQVGRIVLVVAAEGSEGHRLGDTLRARLRPGDRVYWCEPRGIGGTRWTQRNPPNYVARSHVLLGRTVDTGRVWDIAAAARYLKAKANGAPVILAGQGPAAVLAAYAAFWEPDVAEVLLDKPLFSHRVAQAPQFLNVLRVCDIPHVVGMLAPRPVTLIGADAGGLETVKVIYAAAGATDKLELVP